MSPWKPGQRAAELALEEPYEDVPGHLREPLLNWLFNNIGSHELIFEMCIELRLTGYPNPYENYSNARTWLIEHCAQYPDLLLDLVEGVLRRQGIRGTAAQNLEAVLVSANSLYKVRADKQGLEVRIVPEVAAAVQATVTTAAGVNSSGQHLANAWNDAYGRTSDPVKSYSEAIKAVEAAASPVLTPNNLKATLGTLIGDLRSTSSSWTFEIQDAQGVSVVLDAMNLLWNGQTSRHGGVQATRTETLEEARAAVHIATSLVQWFISGAIRKK